MIRFVVFRIVGLNQTRRFQALADYSQIYSEVQSSDIIFGVRPRT